MPVSPVSPLYMSARDKDTEHRSGRSPFPHSTSPEGPFIPGGFPRNGFPTTAITLVVFITLFLASFTMTVGTASFLGLIVLPLVVEEGFCAFMTAWFLLFIRKNGFGIKGLPTVILIAYFLVSLVYASTVPATLLLSVFMIISYGAILLTVAPKKVLRWVPLIPLAATAISLIFCAKNPMLTLVTVLPWPTAILLSVAISRGTKKQSIGGVGLMCVSTLSIGLTVLLVATVLLWHAHGTLTFDLIRQDIELIRGIYVQSILEVGQELTDQVLASGQEIDPSLLKPYTDVESITNTVNLVLNILPGLLIAGMNVFSFFAVSTLTSGLRALQYGPYISRDILTFRMTPYAAITYLVAFFLSAVNTLVGTVGLNLILIFMPGLAFCGFNAILSRLFRKQRAGCLLIILVPLAALCFPMLSVFGAISILIGTVANWIRKHRPQDPSQQNPFGN